MASCYKCAATITQGIDSPMPVEAVCEKCSSYLHACANCASYDEYSYTKCREAKADFVFDRLGKNVCTFFKLKQSVKPDEKQKKLLPAASRKSAKAKRERTWHVCSVPEDAPVHR